MQLNTWGTVAELKSVCARRLSHMDHPALTTRDEGYHAVVENAYCSHNPQAAVQRTYVPLVKILKIQKIL